MQFYKKISFHQSMTITIINYRISKRFIKRTEIQMTRSFHAVKVPQHFLKVQSVKTKYN